MLAKKVSIGSSILSYTNLTWVYQVDTKWIQCAFGAQGKKRTAASICSSSCCFLLIVFVGRLFLAEQSARLLLSAAECKCENPVAHEQSQRKEHTYAQQYELIYKSDEICRIVAEHNILVCDERMCERDSHCDILDNR